MFCTPNLCGRQRLNDEDWGSDLKILVTGPKTTGKSNLCRRFLYGCTVDTVLAGNILGKLEMVDGELCGIRIEDMSVRLPLASHKDDACRLKAAVRHNDGLVIVYSVTDRRSLRLAQQMLTYIQHIHRNTELPTVLVGNAIDTSSARSVTVDEARELSFDLGVSYYETESIQDADTERQVTNIFHDLVRQIRCVRLRAEFGRRPLIAAPKFQNLNFARNISSRLSLVRNKKHVKRKLSN